jgi:hypothetical protein
VVAEKSIPGFTVIGIYGGVLHDDKVLDASGLTSCNKEQRKRGTHLTQCYSWDPTSSKRVSAGEYANILAYINTSKLNGYPRIPGTRNNISYVYVAGVFPVYVTNTFIKAGEELLIDYGSDYESEINAKRLKQEASSRAPSP